MKILSQHISSFECTLAGKIHILILPTATYILIFFFLNQNEYFTIYCWTVIIQSCNPRIFCLLHVLVLYKKSWLVKLYVVNSSLKPIFYNGKSLLHSSTSWLCLVVKLSFPSSAVHVNWLQTWSKIGLNWAWFTCIYFTSSVKLMNFTQFWLLCVDNATFLKKFQFDFKLDLFCQIITLKYDVFIIACRIVVSVCLVWIHWWDSAVLTLVSICQEWWKSK